MSDRKTIMATPEDAQRFDEYRERLHMSQPDALRHLLDHQDETGIYREIDAAARDLEIAIRDHFCAELGDSPALLKTIAINLRQADPEDRGEISNGVNEALAELLNAAYAAKKTAEARRTAQSLARWQGEALE